MFKFNGRNARYLEAPDLPKHGTSRSWMVYYFGGILLIVVVSILAFERVSWAHAGILFGTCAFILLLVFLLSKQECKILFSRDHMVIIDPLNFPGRKRIYFSEIDFFVRTIRRGRSLGPSYKIIALYKKSGRRIGIISDSQPGWRTLIDWFKRHFPQRRKDEIGANLFIQLWNNYT